MNPHDWSRLSGLMFTARTLVDGLYAGGHASPRHGRGVEFHDYRAYAPGDNPAHVDWKLYGRTDRHYLRRYQHHTDLHVHLLVDFSASMAFAGIDRRGRPIDPATSPRKLDHARHLAAAIAMLTLRQGDRVALGLFDDRLRAHVPMAGTWSHLHRVIRALERQRPGTGPGDLGEALRRYQPLIKRHELLVVISDLLDDPAPLLDALSRVRHRRGDALLFQILTSQELDLSNIDAQRLQVVDTETRHQTPTHLPSVSARYRQLMLNHLDALRRGCTARSVDYHLLSTAVPVTKTLREYLARRQMM